MVDLPGRPGTDLRAAVEENLEQAHDARLMDLESGITDGGDGDRARKALEEGKVDMAVEPFGLEAGEAVGDRLEGDAYGVEMVETAARVSAARPLTISNRGR